ncbi:MAG: lipopolysaccharide biosynthesis protein [Nocardioides sp.]
MSDARERIDPPSSANRAGALELRAHQDNPRDAREGGLLGDSAWLLAITIAMAAAGSAFWLIAARMHSTDTVGIAASLIAGIVVISLLAQLGLNVTLIRVLPASTAPRTDILYSCAIAGTAGALLGTGYALIVPSFSPDLAVVRESAWHVAGFAVFAGGTAVNVTTDAAFLATGRVRRNFVVNGVLMGLCKCGLPWVLIGAGSFGLVAAVGLSSVIAAAASLVLVLRGLPRSSSSRPSVSLRNAARFAGAGYAGSVLDLAPILLLPLILVSQLGPASAGVYAVAFQIVSLLNAGVYAIGGSAYAAGTRDAAGATPLMRRAAALLTAAIGIGSTGLAGVAPWLLGIFGEDYAAYGTDALRLLALGSLALAAQYWTVVAQRLHRRLWAMVALPAITSGVVVSAAVAWVGDGIAGVALAWGVGHLCGALVGLVVVVVSREPAIETHQDQAPIPASADANANAGATNETAKAGSR